MRAHARLHSDINPFWQCMLHVCPDTCCGIESAAWVHYFLRARWGGLAGQLAQSQVLSSVPHTDTQHSLQALRSCHLSCNRSLQLNRDIFSCFIACDTANVLFFVFTNGRNLLREPFQTIREQFLIQNLINQARQQWTTRAPIDRSPMGSQKMWDHICTP